MLASYDSATSHVVFASNDLLRVKYAAVNTTGFSQVSDYVWGTTAGLSGDNQKPDFPAGYNRQVNKCASVNRDEKHSVIC